jgi:hypothetical protein
MNKKEIIREIEDEANRQAGDDPETEFVIYAKLAIAVVEALDIA